MDGEKLLYRKDEKKTTAGQHKKQHFFCQAIFAQRGKKGCFFFFKVFFAGLGGNQLMSNIQSHSQKCTGGFYNLTALMPALLSAAALSTKPTYFTLTVRSDI